MTEKKKNISFIGHLEELRERLVKSAIAILVVAVTLFIFVKPLTDTLLMSLSRNSFPTYRLFCWISHTFGLGEIMCASDLESKFEIISIGMTEQFGTGIYFSLVGGVIIAFPYIAYQIWSFIKPGLKQKEIKATSGIIGYSTLLFLLGISFGYFIIAPLAIQFFGTYSLSGNIGNTFKFASYYSLILSATIACGIFFQLPIVVFILSKLGMMTPEVLKKYRRHALVGILVLSAIITPPDVISQVIVAVPVFILYEISIGISRRVIKKLIEEGI